MNVYLGEQGLRHTWQNEFPRETTCHKCGGNARIMFVAIEEEQGEPQYVYDIHDNMKDDKYWPHDAIATAVYLCEKCFEPVAIINQA